jgi:hypothetical protein
MTWCLLLFLFILDNRSHVVAVAGGLLPTGLPPRIWPTLWRVEKQGVWLKKLFFHLSSPINTIKTSINHLPTLLVSGVLHRGYNRSIIIQRKERREKALRSKPTCLTRACGSYERERQEPYRTGGVPPGLSKKKNEDVVALRDTGRGNQKGFF